MPLDIRSAGDSFPLVQLSTQPNRPKTLPVKGVFLPPQVAYGPDIHALTYAQGG